MKDLAQLVVLAVGLSVPSVAGGGAARVPLSLSAEHTHPSGAFSFRTPPGWKIDTSGPSPQVIEATGDGLVVRFWFRPDEAGFDSLHIDCMLDRLAGPMDVEPRVQYEYDFISGDVAQRRFLDSAFRVRYDKAVMGHQDWRQRNLTIVGSGESLCVITHCPWPVWRKSRETRALLDGLVGSIAFKPWR